MKKYILLTMLAVLIFFAISPSGAAYHQTVEFDPITIYLEKQEQEVLLPVTGYYEFTFQVTSKWPLNKSNLERGQFAAKLSNMTNKPVNGWKVTFEDQVDVAGYWQSHYERSTGYLHSFRHPDGYGNVIPKNGSISFGGHLDEIILSPGKISDVDALTLGSATLYVKLDGSNDWLKVPASQVRFKLLPRTK